MVEKEAISVKILDREYTFSCEPNERRQLQDAADYLDQQMRQVRDAGGLPGLEKVAVMAALNITNDFLIKHINAVLFGLISPFCK